MTSEYVEHLERLRVALRHERRALAAELASSNIEGEGINERNLAEFGELQRNLEAVMRALEDETKQAEAKANRIRTANQPEPERQPYQHD
jgi:hypothetical protein